MTLVSRVPPVIATFVRRWPDARVSRSLAYRIGDRMGPGPWSARIITGGMIALDPRDYGHRKIYFFGVIEPNVTALVRGRFRPGWTTLDVGANAGYYSVLASDLGAGRVIGFEPNPRMQPLLALTAASHPVLTVENIAVGSAAGVAMLQISPDHGNTGLSTLGNKWEAASTVEVPIVTLDSYCDDHGLAPDFVKIDVEGHEAHVLEGMMGIIGRRIPEIVVCELTTRRADPTVVLGRFREAGYNAHAMAPDGTLIEPEQRAVRQDVCFIRRR